MQAPEITPDRDAMVPSAAAARCLQRAHTMRMLPGVTARILSLVTFTFDL